MENPVMYRATCPDCGDVVWMTKAEKFMGEQGPIDEQIAICEVCEAQVKYEAFREVPMEDFEIWAIDYSESQRHAEGSQ